MRFIKAKRVELQMAKVEKEKENVKEILKIMLPEVCWITSV
jgi:hypothetical protein